MELREKVALVLADIIERPHLRLAFADRVLAIPEIREALAYMKAVDDAHPVFHEIREMLDKPNS